MLTSDSAPPRQYLRATRCVFAGSPASANEPPENMGWVSVKAAEKSESTGWLVLIYRVPPEPTRLRSTVWRRIKSLGAEPRIWIVASGSPRSPFSAVTRAQAALLRPRYRLSEVRHAPSLTVFLLVRT